jgi:hypothetical protein
MKRHNGNAYKTKQGLIISKFITNLSTIRCTFIKERMSHGDIVDLSLYHTFHVSKQSMELNKNWYR